MSVVQVLFIGQAPPRGVVEVPFGRTHLYKWLASVDINQAYALENFSFTALIDFFPGLKGSSHRPPTPAEITAGQPQLLHLIRTLDPPVIVTVGILSTREVLADESLLLHNVVGKCFRTAPFGISELGERIIIPFPHPSGASSWIYKNNHAALLHQALQLLSQKIKV